MSSQKASVPISVRGRYFWRADSRFIIRGVVYQPQGTDDPISDDHLPQLEHDVLLFKELGLNTLYIYDIDTTKTHTRTMKLLEEEGIYVVTGIPPSCGLNRLEPYDWYNSSPLSAFFRVVDAMANFPNTLGIFAASQSVNNDETVSATPVIRAVVRDLKKYMKVQNELTGQRVIPVGYEAANTAWDKTILEYLCSDNTSRSIDFWATVDFSAALDSSMAQSNFNDLISRFSHVNIPIFVSGYGSCAQKPRQFHETTALYSLQTTQFLSGGCSYEFYGDSNDYGLVEMRELNGDTRNTASLRLIEMLTQHGDTQNANHLLKKSRAYDLDKVVERRETERGLLLIFHDFVNYKSKLAAAWSLHDETEWNHAAAEQEIPKGVSTAGTQSSWPWEPEFYEPDTCVDWEKISSQTTDKV